MIQTCISPRCSRGTRRPSKRRWNIYVNPLVIIWLIICVYESISSTINTAFIQRYTHSIYRYTYTRQILSVTLPEPSLFVKAQIEENRARFILNAGQKRWRLFQSSILDHYSNETSTEGHSLDLTSNDDELPDHAIISNCAYYPHELGEYDDEEDNNDHGEYYDHILWYQICPGKFIRRFYGKEMMDSKQFVQNTKSQEQEYEHVLIDSTMYRIQQVELLGTYSGQNKDYPENDVLNANTRMNEVQIYNNGGHCLDHHSNEAPYTTILDIQRTQCDGPVDAAVQQDPRDNLKIQNVEFLNPCHLIIHACYKSGGETQQGQSIHDYFLRQSDMQHRAHTIDQTRTKINSVNINKNWKDAKATNLQKLQESLLGSFPPMPPSRIAHNIKSIKSMFQHAYDSYMYNAYPHSELKPISCKPGVFDLVRLPALTLIDSLDMLLILQNHTEFARSVERLRNLDTSMRTLQKIGPLSILFKNPVERGGLFAVDQNISVFETNIRVLGGLLSAHQMAEAWTHNKVLLEGVFYDEDGSVIGIDVGRESGKRVTNGDKGAHAIVNGKSEKQNSMSMCIGEDGQSHICSQSGVNDDSNQSNSTRYWNYDGFLLELAHDIGRRLLPAFKTNTGIPYGTVNLLYGIPPSETTIASLAGGGTLSLEMELLSRLTGDPTFGKVAKLSTRALVARRSQLNLLGKHIDNKSGSWTETLSGIGSNSDSIYEYLIKHHALFQEDEDFYTMFHTIHSGINRNGKLGDWYPDVSMSNGLSHANSVFESLAAFYPGMQILLGELNPAARSTNAFTMARESVKFLPERFDFTQFEVQGGHQTYPLRPELYESNYFLHLATKNLGLGNSTSGWLWSADFFLHALQGVTRTDCGFGIVKDITSKATEFALGDEMPSFFLSETLKYLFLTFDDENPINTDKERNWIFTTEAHPIHSESPVSAKQPKKSEQVIYANIKKIDWLDEAKSELLQSLGDLIKSNNTERNAIRIPSGRELVGASGKYFHDEIWTTNTGKFPHIKDLQRSLASQKEECTARRSSDNFPSWQGGSTGRIIENLQNVMGEDAEDETILNFAILTHDRNGRKTTLSQSCPNYHQSNSLWVQALVGEELDYVNSFEATWTNDKYPSIMKPRTSTSLTASGLLGTGYFSADTNKCQKKGKRKNVGANNVANSIGETQRVDMGGSLGSFDISIDSTGVGYYVKHLRSGESVEVTIVQPTVNEKVSDTDVFVAVDSFFAPSSSSSKVKVGLLNQIKSVFSQNHSILRKKRRVLIADMAGNSYECKVELKIKNDEQRKNTHQKIATFPCLPAAYGKTSMENLNNANNEGVEFEALLKMPADSDPYGCHEDWDEEESKICDSATQSEREDLINDLEEQLDIYYQLSSEFLKEEMVEHENLDIDEILQSLEQLKEATEICRPAGTVQLVQRGKCSFRSKGLNQAARFNAEALIVINSESRRLFIMAGVLTQSQQNIKTDEPLSVLVTKDDGEEMMNIVDRYSHENKQVTAAVRIIPRSSNGQMNKKIDKSKQTTIWPVVMTSPANVQIHSSQGWGVGAVKENGNWQVVLLENKLQNVS